LRIVATDANGGQQIYDTGALSTLDLPDATGWYRISIENVHAYDPSLAELEPGFTPNFSAIHAGSVAGAIIQAFPGLVTDGSIPTPDESGAFGVYDYNQIHPESESLIASTGVELMAAPQAASATSGVWSFLADLPGDFSIPVAFKVIGDCLAAIWGALCSTDPIRYSDGAVDYSATDIESDGLGETLAFSRSWTSTSNLTLHYNNGTGWIDNALPTLYQAPGGNTVTITRSGMDSETFVYSNGQYIPTTYVSDTLVRDAANHEFIWRDSQGNEIHFSTVDSDYDFAAATLFSRTIGRWGQFKSMTDADGNVTQVGWIAGVGQEVQRKDANGNVVESWLYTYLSGADPNSGCISSVELRRPDGQGGWTTAQKVTYDYCETGDSFGNLHDLKTAVVTDADDNVLSTEYYRYYTSGETGGYAHGLKYVFDSESYARLCAAVGNPELAVNALAAPYATQYFEYDKDRRCTRHDVQGAGGTATGGIGTFTYQYFSNATYSADTNQWQYKTVETLPDGNQNTVYCNSLGNMILKDFYDITDTGNPLLSGQHWYTYCQYDSLNRVVLEAEPSAVTGYSFAGNMLSVTLAVGSGTIYLTDYYTSTTATETTAGGVNGYVQNSKVKQGSSGTPILLETWSYYRKTEGNKANVVTASDTVYANANGTGAETTSYTYTWYAGAVGVQSLAALLPAVTDENASGSDDVVAACFDKYGRAIWTKDADGYINYYEYDNATGAVAKFIADVDTTQTGAFTGLPTGWSTPTGGGRHQITTAEVDAFGRTVKQTDAEGNVSYVVYDDANHEIRTYAGWNVTTHNTTGAIKVYREDLAGNYTETLAYVWNDASGVPVDASGRPTGAESLADTRVTILSMTRALLNSAGQIVSTREYINLTGLTYSTARQLGVNGGNYVQTDATYGVWGNMTTVTNALGHTTTYAYDSNANVVAITDALGKTIHYGYDVNGNLVSVTDALSHTTDYGYDLLGRQTSETDAEGSTTTYAYNNCGDLVSVTDDLGNVTTYDYDARGRIHTIVDDLENVTTYTYDARGNVVVATDDLNHATQYAYDGARDLTSVTDSLNHTSAYTYDGNGNLLTVTDSLGHTTTYAYDSLGRQVSVADALSHTTTYGYDPLGQLLSKTDAEGGVTSYAYNAVGELTSTTDANGDTTTYTYDAVGNVSTMTDAEDNTTSYTYDDVDRVLTETNELNGTRSYVYNDVGYLVQKTDRNGRVVQYVYDDVGRVTTENWLDAQQSVIYTIEYAYDDLGRMAEASDATSTCEYEYDDLGQLVEQTQTFADLTPTIVHNYTYDDVGNCTQIAVTVGGTADYVTDYTYDAVGRVASIRQHGVTGGNAVAEKRIDFTYDAVGQYATMTRYADLAGTQVVATGTYTFDNAYKLAGLVYTKGATTLASYSYTYDDADNMTGMTTVDGATDYTNDDAGQLTGADSDYTGDEAYVYDDNGNRVTANGATYVTGDNNQLLSDGTYRYSYDAEGNRTAKFVDTDADGVLDDGDTNISTYTWDFRNRLVETEHFTGYTTYSAATPISNWAVSYTYDAFNRLISRSLDADGSGGTGDIHQSIYVYDGDQIALQFDKTYANGSASDLATTDLSHRYLWNPQTVDQLFADEQVHYDSGEEAFVTDRLLWALADHENSVRDLAAYDPGTDTTTVANHRVYDSFGNLKSETNAAVDCLFGYTGRQFDKATGLQNNVNRWYDSVVGRWVSEDPIGFGGGDSNINRYVRNAPGGFIDPNGLGQIPSLPSLVLNQPKSYPVVVDNKEVGRVTVTLKEPQGAYREQVGSRPGIHIEYEPNATPNKGPGKNDVGWSQHVVSLDIRRNGGKVEVSFEQTPRYDNGSVMGRMGEESDPTNPVQPNEDDRPSRGPWHKNPWYGGPGGPDGTGPKGHCSGNPQPQSSIFDRPGAGQYLGQLVSRTGNGGKDGNVLFNYYYYVDEDGGIHGIPMSKDLVKQIKMPE
jgi:RHS repeat-associated protein